MYKYLAIIGTVIVAALCVVHEIAAMKGRKAVGDENRQAGNAGRLNADNGVVERILGTMEKTIPCAVALGLIFLVYLVTRLFHLGIAPTGFHVDECGMAYDALCLAKSGVDRWGHAYPVYLANFNTGQSSLYAYSAMILLKIFPFSFKLMRIPAVIYGAFALFAMFYIGTYITGKRIGGLIASALLVITPYFLMSERWALDCNLFLSWATISMAITLYAVEKDKVWTYVVTGIVWGITFYTYIISYLIVPVVVIAIALMIIGLKKEKSVAKIVGMFAPVALMGIPLMLEQLVNLGIIPEFSFLGSDYFVFSLERTQEFSLSNIATNFGLITKQLFTNDELSYNAIPQFGAVLMPMLPLFYYGFYLSVKNVVIAIKDKKASGAISEILVLLFMVFGYLEVLVIKKPNFNRYNELFLPILVLIVIALYEMLGSKISVSQLSAVGSIAIICLCFLFFGKYYFADMNDEYGRQLLFESMEVGDAITQSQLLYDVDKGKEYYLEIEYDMQAVPDLIVACAGDVSQEDWLAYTNGETGDKLGRFNMHFPEDFDENVDAIYIIGNTWNHISGYIESIGFGCDRTFEHYAILHK